MHTYIYTSHQSFFLKKKISLWSTTIGSKEKHTFLIHLSLPISTPLYSYTVTCHWVDWCPLQHIGCKRQKKCFPHTHTHTYFFSKLVTLLRLVMRKIWIQMLGTDKGNKTNSQFKRFLNSRNTKDNFYKFLIQIQSFSLLINS